MLLHFFVHRRKSCTFVPSKTERFMDRIRLKDKEFELFIPESDIQAAIAKMAVQIKADVEGKNPLFVGVLNGAFMFVAELMRELDVPYELTFARYSSYQGTSSTGILNEIMPVQADICGRMVILLEDIIDTTMLFKPESLKCELTPDYVGLQIPADFIVGHGLDYDELGRSYKDIYKVVE